MVISFKESLTERTSNPLVSSYIFFILAMNWKILVILLFGEGDISDRMRLIETHSYHAAITLIVPLVLSILYVFLMPKISLYIQIFQEKTLTEQKQRKIDNELQLATARKKIIEETVSAEQVRNRIKLDLKEREAEIDEKIKNDEHQRKYDLLNHEHNIEIRRVELERDEYESRNQNLIKETKTLKSEISRLIKDNNNLNLTISKFNKQI
ncbi:MAG TPA: hypothetical protein DDZ90_00145 [Planctomycetaceae bacterium]|nr:hypothetical protein [Gimesia sp.]HBL41785.1 hypothetical protein [Planctomycetaceae bacterium]